MTTGLRDALVHAGPDDLVPVVVLMEEFPDRGELLEEVRGLNREDRRAHVVATMKSLAERSQRGIHATLATEHGGIRNVRVLWGVNGVALEARPGVIERLAPLPGVRNVMVDGGRGRPADAGAELAARSGGGTTSDLGVDGTGPTGGDISGPNPDATVRGEVIAMGARQVWEELGYTGAGVIVAVIDTGVDPTHPDLADHIWTNLDEVPDNGLDDDGNGHIDDTWGWDFCDDDNTPNSGAHGTQVAGQVAGDGTDGVVTGMAPDAELMVIGINCNPPDSIGWLASDYAIENGAHIITESYIWPWEEDTPDFEGWRRQMDTELAAGIIHAAAAGNDGANPVPAVPYNVSTPANCPPPWLHPDQTLVGGVSSTLTVGNIEWSTDVIASSSSRGPSAWEDIRTYTDPGYPFTLTPALFDYPYENGAQMGLIKPDLSAYGNGTTSTCPGPSYCGFSGTSSATPHVAGAMALMLQANPEATPAELAEALMTTAEHRGNPGKNNVYGTGLLQAHPAVLAVESGVLYESHTIDDAAAGNADLMLDPGEQVTMTITVESRTDAAVDGLEAILSTTTPGVTIHDHYATYPTLPARGTAVSDAPHFTLSIDPAACSTVVTFDLEVRNEGKVRRSSFHVRVGEPEPLTLMSDDFESDLGWTSDPGAATQGSWVREDPIGVVDGVGQPSNPEDDTSDPGVTCWVTGNGELNGRKDENNNDVDGGAVTLLSPPFGDPYMLSLSLSYDRWYYDNSGGGDFFKAEVSNDGGQSWTVAEHLVNSTTGWGAHTVDLFALLPPTDDMRLRFVVQDGSTDTAVEGAVDEVSIDGIWVRCQEYSPPFALAPNPVGDTLVVAVDPGGHTVLTWTAPPVDAGHDAATLYRIERAVSPSGPFTEAGSATSTSWVDVDALDSTDPYYYRVRAENAGGTSP
jgi:subtilisin family serine protease